MAKLVSHICDFVGKMFSVADLFRKVVQRICETLFMLQFFVGSGKVRHTRPATWRYHESLIVDPQRLRFQRPHPNARSSLTRKSHSNILQTEKLTQHFAKCKLRWDELNWTLQIGGATSQKMRWQLFWVAKFFAMLKILGRASSPISLYRLYIGMLGP